MIMIIKIITTKQPYTHKQEVENQLFENPIFEPLFNGQHSLNLTCEVYIFFTILTFRLYLYLFDCWLVY